MRRVVSLRIPGVDYPTAESVLGASTTEQVDDVMTRGQFWRHRAEERPSYIAEAYLWGKDGKPDVRALSMLLLPFTLMNVAYWARPPSGRGVVHWMAHVSVGVICRLVGLTLTVTLMLAAAGATMDLIAWQCLGTTGCASSWPQPFNLIGEVPLAAGQRLAIGAAVPLLLLVGLWSYSYMSWRRHERRVEIPVRPDEDQLTKARFWSGRDWVDRLRACHALVGMAVVDGLLVYPMARSDHDHGSPLAWVGVTLLVLVLGGSAIAVVGAVLPLSGIGPSVKNVPTQVDGRANRRWRGTARRAYRRAVGRLEDSVDAVRLRVRRAAGRVTVGVRRAAWVNLGITGAALIYAAWPRSVRIVPAGPVPGYAGFVVLLSILQVLLLVALGFAVLPLCRSGGRRMALLGFVAPIIASTAVLLAVAETAGTLYFTALSIGQLRPSGAGRAWEPAPPYPYEWAGLVFAIGLGCTAIAGGALAVLWRWLVREGTEHTDKRDGKLRGHDSASAALIDHAYARGRILKYIPRLSLIIFVPAAAVSIAGVVFSALGTGPSVLFPSPALPNLGTWSIGLLAIVFVVLVARTGTMTPMRRTISTIWALATFWPRAAHPFAAPAHGPRAVADLIMRITRLHDSGHPVLIAGHSHGALLATVAASYLPDEVAANTALLTSANTATRLIEPFFGAFYDRTVCLRVANTLTDADGTRWRNLYRVTDPIGGQVFMPVPGEAVPAVDRLAHDPPEPRDGGQGLGVDPTVLGHDSYLHDPVFIEEHANLVSWLAGRRTGEPVPAADLRVPS